MTERMNSWIEQLYPIIEEFKDGDEDALDGDAVDELIEKIRNELNLHEGNITQREYDELMG